MFAITGITGKVGGALARALLEAEQPVRAVLRDAGKSEAWVSKGCEIALAEMEDAEALATAFRAAEGVFILPPADFDPQPGYPEARRVIDAVVSALRAARPDRVVCLSTIGADAAIDNLLTQRTLMEEAVSRLDLPVAFLRPGWFLDNAVWDVASARNEGVIRSFLMPADRRIAMVAAEDVGRTAAELILQRWEGRRIVELEGPMRVSPDDIAAAFGRALGHPVRVELVPRHSWEELFRAQGMSHPEPRMRMIDGFNEGWIDFPGTGDIRLRGTTNVDAVVSGLVAAAMSEAA